MICHEQAYDEAEKEQQLRPGLQAMQEAIAREVSAYRDVFEYHHSLRVRGILYTCCNKVKASSSVKTSSGMARPCLRSAASSVLSGGTASLHSRSRSPWLKTVRGVPWCTRRPLYRTKSQSVSAATSAMSCEITAMVTPCFSRIRRR